MAAMCTGVGAIASEKAQAQPLHWISSDRGTWRTMLSDEPVFEAKMLRGSNPFHFTIEEEQAQLRREGTQPVTKEKKKQKSGTIFSKYFP